VIICFFSSAIICEIYKYYFLKQDNMATDANQKEIILIQPPIPKSIRKDYISVQFPLGLGYIAKSLSLCEVNVTINDFVVEQYNTNRFIEQLKRIKPVLIGFTALTCSIPFVHLISKHIKRHNPQTITVLGGAHASALPLETLRELPCIDFIVVGEGEIIIKELYQESVGSQNYHKVKGIAFREKDTGALFMAPGRELIENLDNINFHTFGLFDVEKYCRAHVSRGFSRKELSIMELLTSRGCPESCIFCAGHISYGRTLRFRSIENIISAIEKNNGVKKIEHISIEDDTFTFNRKLVLELGNYLKSKNITWNCNARIGTIDEDLATTMSQNNCRKISFGIESGSERILRLIKKNITIPQIINTFKFVRRVKIRYVEGNFMLGSHPDEKLEDIKMTEKLIFKLQPDFLTLTVMCPFPGTEVYEIMNNASLLAKRKNWLNFNLVTSKLPYKRLYNLSADELLCWRNWLLKKYYTSPAYIFRQIFRVRNIKELKYLLRLAKSVVKNNGAASLCKKAARK